MTVETNFQIEMLAGEDVSRAVAGSPGPLLLAFGLPGFPLKVSAIIGALKTGLMFVLVRPLGFLAQAGLMSAYLALTVLINVFKGLSLLNHADRHTPTPAGEEN